MMSLGSIIIYLSIWFQPQDNPSQIIDVSRREGDKVFSTSTKQQIRQAPPASKLPFKCGMVFFYHVPSTGGATINQWLMEYTSKRNGTPTYYTHGSREKGKEERHASIFAQGGKNVHGGMNEFVTNFTSDEWRVVHCHHSSLHLNASEHLLSQWRSTVESLGCGFVANVMFRDPLGHTLSLFKHVERFQSSRDVWAKHLYTRSERGHWATQLDYFLYNFITRNPDGVDAETKVQRALSILRNHFDIVSVGDHVRFKKELMAMTGWEDREMKRTNTHSKDLTFSKSEVEEMQKLMTANGDTEFIYQVKKMYN
eukprot:CAMPEP_0198137198 /NCGR_PEP_ID=MMETSP1443-20131203/730_1 /TAXON_ID=186043 /ORGANISM="Entomoneis sp., Strain CCMP2396" /LENGTH=310 /DNA_ID=CAMNT_0043798551 /DNA_START=87 /DNA_END=1019 /DNA_ORIENTATION=+